MRGPLANVLDALLLPVIHASLSFSTHISLIIIKLPNDIKDVLVVFIIALDASCSLLFYVRFSI